MGLFSRKRVATAPALTLLGSGRRFSSSLEPGEAVARVQELMDAYAPRTYPTLPHMVPAGSRWFGPETQAPDAVYAANLIAAPHPGKYLVLTFRRSETGTEIGAFPPGAGDGRLSIPFAGQLKMLDDSLSSIGTFPGQALGLTAPPIPSDLVVRTLEGAGYPLFRENLEAVAKQLFLMTQMKANGFLDALERPDASRRRADWEARARFGPALVEPMAMVLNDLAERAGDELPLIQDIPLRVHSVLLQVVGTPGSFWDQVTKAPEEGR